MESLVYPDLYGTRDRRGGPPRPRSRPATTQERRRRWPWIVGAVAALVALCLAVPVAAIAVPILRRTIEAGQGSNSPQEALLSFVLTIDPPTERKRLEAERLIVRSQRKTVSQQRTEFINAMDTHNRRHTDQTARLVVAYDEQHQDQVDIDGNHATALRLGVACGAWVQGRGKPPRRKAAPATM